MIFRARRLRREGLESLTDANSAGEKLDGPSSKGSRGGGEDTDCQQLASSVR